MPYCALDHVVVTAPTLTSGVEWVRDVLGVAPQAGGAHREMGTHNCLLRLGDSAYLEVIAVDPGAPAPDRQRWFGLDRLAQDDEPRLAAWVARTPDIRTASSACSEPVGSIERMSRGDLSWLITIPEDGSLPLNGAGPMLIEWPVDAHPVSRLPDSGCKLLRLEAFHPDAARVSAMLRAVRFNGPVHVSPLQPDSPPYLAASIENDGIPRQLGGP